MSTSDQTATAPAAGRPRTDRAWRWVIGVGGAVLAGAAAIDVVTDDGDGPVTWLLVVGAVLATLPLWIDRLTRVRVGADGLHFDLSKEIAELGARDTAKRIDEWGGGLAEATYAYASAHTVLRDDERDHTMRPARIRLQDHFVDTASASALVQQYDEDEVRKLFRKGPPVVRVLVLGLMLGDQSLADVGTIESAITESRTANEQYLGLQLAKRVGRRLSRADRAQLRKAIQHESIPGGRRTELRAEVLVLLADDADGPSAAAGPAPTEPAAASAAS